jgi:hypothetical protein
VINVFGNAVEKQRGIALVVFAEPINFRRNDIDSLVGEILNVTATAAGEDPDQTKSNFLVLLAGFVTISVQPAQ